MKLASLLTVSLIAFSSPTLAQKDHDMQGMDHQGMDHQGMSHQGMEMEPASPAGNAPPPPVPPTFYADRLYSPDEMATVRNGMFEEHGGGTFSQIMLNLAEYQITKGRDGYRWDGEGWFGDDLNRFVVKSEGEGQWREDVESAELQALYSRSLDPYWNLQAGARHDFEPEETTYATVGIEGLAPYWFEVEGALFLSDKGDLLGRAEGYYDQRITQRLVLQPRAELNFSAQDVPEHQLGSGLSNAELGLRLRYEFTREFAPYIGVSYDRKFGDTARFSRAHDEDTSSTSIVIGVRTWF